MYQQIEGLQLR